MRRLIESEKKFFLLGLGLLLILELSPLAVYGGAFAPRIENLSIKDRDGLLICSFKLENGLTDEVKKALNSGITIKYTYFIELLRPGLFRNKKVKEIKRVRYLTYDHLKQEYHILLGPGEQKMVSVRSEEEAERFVFQLKDVEVVRFKSILQGSVYILRVRAIIEQVKEAALPFKRLIGLFWKNSIATDWNEIRFRY